MKAGSPELVEVCCDPCVDTALGTAEWEGATRIFGEPLGPAAWVGVRARRGENVCFFSYSFFLRGWGGLLWEKLTQHSSFSSPPRLPEPPACVSGALLFRTLCQKPLSPTSALKKALLLTASLTSVPAPAGTQPLLFACCPLQLQSSETLSRFGG